MRCHGFEPWAWHVAMFLRKTWDESVTEGRGTGEPVAGGFPQECAQGHGGTGVGGGGAHRRVPVVTRHFSVTGGNGCCHSAYESLGLCCELDEVEPGTACSKLSLRGQQTPLVRGLVSGVALHCGGQGQDL